MTQVNVTNDIEFGSLSISNIRNIGADLQLNLVGDVTLDNIVSIDDPNSPAPPADIFITTTGSIDVAGAINNLHNDADADIALVANGVDSDITIDASVSTAEGSITVQADDQVEFLAAGGRNSADTGDVSVTANADGSDGNDSDGILMADSSIIDAGSGEIGLFSTGTDGGSIEISSITTTNNSADSVLIQSNTSVIDGGGTNTDIVAN